MKQLINNFQTLLLILITSSALGQGRELIPNNDFEDFKRMKSEATTYAVSDKAITFDQLKYWSKVNGNRRFSTPDYYYQKKKKRKKKKLINTDYGSIETIQNGCVGIMVFNGQNASDLNYREYLTIRLREELEIGASYEIKFHFTNGSPSKAKNFGAYKIKNLGLLFTKNKPKVKNDDASLIIIDTPQVKIDRYLYSENWDSVSVNFEADSNLRFLTIGYFSAVSLKDLIPGVVDPEIIKHSDSYGTGGRNHSYYFFDNFSLKKIRGPKEKEKEKEKEPKKNLKEKLSRPDVDLCETTMNLQYLQYEKAKTTFRKDVLKKALMELDLITDFLKKDLDKSIEIRGHTEYFPEEKMDSISHSKMFELSKKRADKVKTYLINEKGIKAERIHSIGLGVTEPLIKKEDAAINRRIEIRILCNKKEDVPIDSTLFRDSTNISLSVKGVEEPALIDSIIEVSSKDSNLVFNIGQEFRINYSKNTCLNFDLNYKAESIPPNTLLRVEKAKYQDVIRICKDDTWITGDWYKVSFTKANVKKEGWIFGLHFINPELLCH